MKKTRAKFYCNTQTQHAWSDQARTFRFQAVYDPDGSSEDQAFSRATPAGTLEIQVDKPESYFTVGKYYYLDFTEAD